MKLNHIKGIYYIGQYGTSGYASAARGYLYHYHTTGVPITWEPLYFDNSVMEDDEYNKIVKKLINKPIIYDTVILHCTPDLWSIFRKDRPELLKNKLVIGYCAWESEVVSDEWVESINKSVNELWVPSEYNKKVFFNNGVKTIIRVVPHVFLKYKLPKKSEVSIGDKNLYTFYTIGEFNERKNLKGVIESFCKEFNSHDEVRLLIKTFYKNHEKINRIKCKRYLNEIITEFSGGDKKNITMLLQPLTNFQINELHSIGDCYVGLSRSEGFGLPIYEAYNYGKRIITTAYGGQIDYLKSNYKGLVDYEMVDVNYMVGNYAGHMENKNNKWAEPNLQSARKLMRQAYTEWKMGIKNNS